MKNIAPNLGRFGTMIYTIVKVDGATPKRWLSFRGHDKPIHGSFNHHLLSRWFFLLVGFRKSVHKKHFFWDQMLKPIPWRVLLVWWCLACHLEAFFARVHLLMSLWQSRTLPRLEMSLIRHGIGWDWMDVWTGWYIYIYIDAIFIYI